MSNNKTDDNKIEEQPPRPNQETGILYFGESSTVKVAKRSSEPKH